MVKGKKKLLQEIVYVLFLLVAMIIVFQWYTAQNSRRMEERNKNYAVDSARQMAVQIDEELQNALNLINVYSHFQEHILTEPVITPYMLQEIESNSLFDAVLFTDRNGIDYTSDGRTADAAARVFYNDGIKGNSNITIVFDSIFFDETMACFYAPVRFDGEIIGVLRGAYLAEEYLQDMLKTTYFGEPAEVFLCMPDGTVIACSDANSYHGDLIAALLENGVIDTKTADGVRKVFTDGGEGAFICDDSSKIDNICVRHLPQSGFVLVQAFPEKVTQSMVRAENFVGVRLEVMMIGLFVIYIIYMIVRANHEKRQLEREKREMGYIIDGVTTLFTRFAMVDFENGTYRYLAGTKPEDSGIQESGEYEELIKYLSSSIINEDDRAEFAGQIGKNALTTALKKHNDVRFECYVMRNGNPEWEHVNIICLERKDGEAVKVLFTRQNITEIKEKELKIQAEMSLANRKERQYRIAITSNSISTYEFNLTKDLLEEDVVYIIDGKKVSLLKKAGMEAPCKASEWMEKCKPFILEESLETYSAVVNIEYL
ncbi:MAG: cache domain-containing protein, partial [Lachnospiraceae bacterium]|nr:cache domain-containing protein [Lachnospiraceae bacterium]